MNVRLLCNLLVTVFEQLAGQMHERLVDFTIVAIIHLVLCADFVTVYYALRRVCILDN